MSAIDAQQPIDLPHAGSVEVAPAPVVASDNVTAPVVAPTAEELPKAEGEAVAPVEEHETKPEEKVIEPIHSGALGYKAPGLKNAFRFNKKYFWFGEEAVPSSNLSQYLRGEKPEVAHPVVAWSSQTGKGLLFFVKHADQKEHPAGALNLAYATDLVKDGTIAFALKISGQKHTFEAQTAPERDGWFVAVEKAISDAQETKDGIESSEGYKEHKEKLGKPTTLAVASASTPKKSTEAPPKLADSEAPATEEPVVAPARAGSASSSSDQEKKAKKSKSRSVSRGKRASIFGVGGLLGKKEKEPKAESEAAKTEPEIKKDESAAVPSLGDPSFTAPVITTDIPKPSEELQTELTSAPVVAAPVEELKTEETPSKVAEEKPKITKRASIFGSFVEKLKSPKEEKKQHDFVPVTENSEAVTTEPVSEASKPLEEAQVAAPAAAPVLPETTATEPVPEPEENKPAATATPIKEKESFSFGRFFSKERAKSPAAREKAPEPTVDAAPQIEDTTAAPVVTEPVVPETAQPVEESVVPEPTEKKEETPAKLQKRSNSIFGTLSRSLSKATGKNIKKEGKKETPVSVVPEDTKSEVPASADKPTETPALDAPVEKTIGDVPAEAITAGEPKSTSNPTVAPTA